MPADGPHGTDGIQLPGLPGGRWVRSLCAPALAAAGFAGSVLRGFVAAVAALPRIAGALETLAALDGTLRGLSELRGSIERIEQLGTFVATEVPESLHQLEGIRGELAMVSTRLAEVNQALLNLTLTPRELDRVRRRLHDTTTPLTELADRLEALAKTTPLPRRTPRERSS